MTMKQRILASLKRLDEDATIDQAIDRLVLLKKIEIGLQQMREGRFIDHDELFDRLMKDDEKKGQAGLDRTGGRRSSRNKGSYRKGPAANGRKIRQAPKKVRG